VFRIDAGECLEPEVVQGSLLRRHRRVRLD
jgi:hypothetical protein